MPRKLTFIHCEGVGQMLGTQFLRFMQESDIQYLIPTVKMFLQFSKHPPNVKELKNAVEDAHFLMAVPLLDHNAMILFNNRLQGNDESDQNVLVSALDVLHHPESIHSMSADDHPYPSSCRMFIPRRSLIVPLEEVKCVVFLEQVVALGSKAEFPLREQKARKAGHDVTETRKPAKPTYVFDWLMNTLQMVPSSMTPEIFSKNIRLDSMRRNKNEKPWTRSATWVALKSLVHLSLVQLHGFTCGTEIYKCNILRFQLSFVRKLLELHRSRECRRDFGELREMCAYLTKKASKLERSFPSRIQVLKETCETCESVDQVVTAEWNQYLKEEKLRNIIDIESLGRIDFASDTWNPLPTARDDLEEALRTDSVVESMRRQNSAKSICMTDIHVHLEHLADYSSQMQSNPQPWVLKLIQDLQNSSKSSSEYLERSLQVTETFIRLHLWPHREQTYLDVEKLLSVTHSLLITYQEHCAKRYQVDAVRLSKMILYCCVLVAWMDAVYIRWDPLQLLKNHRLFIVAHEQLQNLLLMDVADVSLLQELYHYISIRTTGSLKPGIMDVSSSGLAYTYASKDASMLDYEQQYFLEDECLESNKEIELEETRTKYHELKSQVDRMECSCIIRQNLPLLFQNCQRCLDRKRLGVIEYSVSVYEKRLPENEVGRRLVIFHHLMPKHLVHLVESCAFLVSLCMTEDTGFQKFNGYPYTWTEIVYTRRIALGSQTKSFLNCHYGKNPSILTSSSNFIVPQGKNVNLLFRKTDEHEYVTGEFKWDLTRYWQLPIVSPYDGLTFTAHGTSHTQNDVLAIQCLCPADLELTSFNEFGTLRAGGYLQWRNLAAAFEGSTLDLNSLPVAMLFLQTAYQVGPLPADQHWNFDLSEKPFVRLLFDHIELAVKRIELNWSAHRALFVCISIAAYAVERLSPEMASEGLKIIDRCRQICLQWSSSVESLITRDASRSVDVADKIRSLLYINCLIVLTFVDESAFLSEEELFHLLRARTIMFERRSFDRDEELERIVSLCSRMTARHEKFIHQLLVKFQHQPLSHVTEDRWPQGQVYSWTRCTNSDFYQATCSSHYSHCIVIHLNVFDGTFLVDGEPIGRLSDRILAHPLFQKNFPSFNVPVLHRGGGVFETTCLKDVVYTFAILDKSRLLVKELRNGRAFRLIDSQVFNEDLPQPLVDEYSFWMAYDGTEHYIELRRPGMSQIGDFRPSYRIDLNSDFKGQVKDSDSERLIVNF